MCEACTVKRCAKCGEEFPASTEYFYRSSSTKDGLYPWCRGCAREHARDKYVSKPKEETPTPETKTCPRCQQEFPATLEHFTLDSDAKSGLYCYCRSCAREYQREREIARRGIPTKKHRAYCEDVPDGMKRCLACESDLPATIEHFHKTTKNKDGLSSYCRTCNAIHSQKWATENPDRVREIAHRWSKANPERKREMVNASAARHRGTKWKYYQEHREEIMAWVVQYNKAHPEVKRGIRMNRRGKIRGAGGRFTHADLAAQYELQCGRCYWCLCELGDNYHADHYVPVAGGGSNDPSNIVCACPSCNHRKHSKMPDVFRQELIDEGILERLDALLASTLVCAYNIQKGGDRWN